ncbi:GtrA family protein [Humibacter ginsenosidimutans]|uniref:GtrA family protein n=1 Tax=Humibacter ginsenosidimutans TaxID=2599293 RepID=A0A5B8M479_9MICO|nr:GtrA family protein [Humibacter ginsenosidimutans]QDZ15001.1 GtrA family protein [Humibacter ginsenosidimutans]
MITSERLRQAAGLSARFLIVGALSTVIEIGLFNLFFLAFGWSPVWAKIASSLIALVNAYFGNREWAFRHRGRHGRLREAILFLIVNALCTGLGVAIVWAGEWMFGRGPLVVNIVNVVSIGIVVLVRFVLYHWVVFPGHKDARVTAPQETPA